MPAPEDKSQESRSAGGLRLAVAQSPVSADPRRNAAVMIEQLDQAAAGGADLVLFAECALSGYAGTHFPDWRAYSRAALAEAEQSLASAAARRGLCAVFGTSHFEGPGKPFNALRAVGPDGRLLATYAKRACNDRDLQNYRPGRTSSDFVLNEVRIGLAICLDARFPPFFADYRARGCDLVLCAYYTAGLSALPDRQPHHLVAVPTLQAHAANHVMWVAAANAADRKQAFPSAIADPDGRVIAKARRDRAGLIWADIETEGERMAFWRFVRDFRRSILDGSRYGTPPLDLLA